MKPDEDQSPNGKKKTILIIAISLMIGFGGGWFSFRSKEIAYWHKMRALMYETGVSDEDLEEIYKTIPEIMAGMEGDDRMTTVVSLAAFKQLEAGRIEKTKEFLAGQVASYYFIYGPPDNPEKNISEENAKMLKAIQKAMDRSPFLEAEVKKTLSKNEK